MNDRQLVFESLMDAINDVGVLDVDDVQAVFDRLPSEDLQPVVRCKYCRHFELQVEHYGFCYVWGSPVSDDEFCSYGEKKEG